MYDRLQLNVTRPDPIGYLCLSVSIPVHSKLFEISSIDFKIIFHFAAYLRKQHHQINRSLSWLDHRQSIFHAMRQQTPFLLDLISVKWAPRSWNQL